MGYEIEEEVVHDELGDCVIKNESYMEMGDTEVQEVIFKELPEYYTSPYGCGIQEFWDGYVVTVAVLYLKEKDIY